MFNCKSIRVELTNRCNLKCSFCYANANTRVPINDEMDTELLKLFISKFKQEGGEDILFTGGECLLRKDIYTLLSNAKSLGLNTMMFTNGTLLTESVVNNIKDYIDYVYISLDGNKKEHELSRGVDGCFSLVLNAFEALNKYNIPFAIETVVTEENYNNLDWLDKFIAKYNIRNIIIAPLHSNNKMVLSYKQQKELLQIISKKNEQFHYKVHFKSNLHNKYDILINYTNFDNCVTPWVLANGTIIPFLTFKKEWDMGNIHDYINDSIDTDIINKRKNILSIAYNTALSRDIFDIQEIIQEII